MFRLMLRLVSFLAVLCTGLLVSAPAVAQPVLDLVVPAAAPVGATITLTGSGFASADNRVGIGPVILTGVASSDGGTVIAVTVPTLDPGSYSVRVRAGGITSNMLPFEVTGGCDEVLPTPAPPTPDPPTPTSESSFRCTQVIGFSQTGSWFESGQAGAFLDQVDASRWQLLRQNGSNIDFWAAADYAGWDQPIFSACAEGSLRPERVVFTISGASQTDPTWWRDNILAAVDTLLNGVNHGVQSNPGNLAANGVRYGLVREVVLQPVVGGPDDGFCAFPSTEPVDACNVVRATYNHTFIDEGIFQAVLAADFPGVVVSAGLSPEVAACGEYNDSQGHLTGGATVTVGAAIGQFYAD